MQAWEFMPQKLRKGIGAKWIRRKESDRLKFKSNASSFRC